jgi:23S rRNA pseudouridine1911/1915/1917 synthase
VQRLVDEGAATVNGERRKPATKLRAGDRVVVEIRRDDDEEAAPAVQPVVSILFEDEHLMALDKNAGVVVHPVGVHQQGTLLQELHRRADGGALPKLIHRIDQFTSGVLLVAKSDSIRVAFSDMLERGEVEKEYDALLLGRTAWEERVVAEPIGSVGDSRILMGVDAARGKPALSRFRAVERFRFATHAAVRIETGRTHQIRVHAAHVGHPLVGDHLYGDSIALAGFDRFALHARRVAFRHPASGAAVRIEAPLPEPFLEALAALRVQ